MFSEILDYLITPSTPEVKKLGYLYESIATTARYKRCHMAWQPHLEQCKSTILAAASTLNNKQHIVLLGGGMLHDIPLPELAAGYQKVTLVDVVFSRDTLKAAKGHHHVSCVTADITGIASELLSFRAVFPLLSPKFTLPEKAQDASLVVSVNVLSQLPYIPLQYLKKHGASKKNLSTLAHTIINTHIQGLQALPQALLITDYQTDIYEREGGKETLQESRDLLRGITLPSTHKQWKWEIAPYGERQKNRRYVNHITCSNLK